MAYYSGQAASYQELFDVLVNACVLNGWIWADNILNKNDVYIRLLISTIGITATGGSGKSGSNLLNSSPTSPRMGNMHASVNLPVFPVQYHIFIFDNEVYIKFKFNINSFYYLAFGKSQISLAAANGLWISASACGAGTNSNSGGGVIISPTNGGSGGGVNPSPVAPFWNTNSYVNNWTNAVLMHGFDGVLWSSSSKHALAVSALSPLHTRQPSNWNNESILLPINIYVTRPSNKRSLACQIENARLLRIDNHEPEQIIQLGADKWMVFPFYKKNINSRDGTDGTFGDHTGTFGWAIRYDGP